ncbi:MAG: cobyrinate a,c-diamide synthase [Leptolyngbya sp. DLM2.Bin15]|nr:MAG: cobyrinate a,c-diamide synthase [Leptolyngbya sp. DLM2.Bin15]
MQRQIPMVAIAGTQSGVGKTSVAIGLMRAWQRRGLRVQPFKVGPDFIDPGHHRLATGRISYNLDGWMLSPLVNRQTVYHACQDADVAVMEGVMGLFDGYGDTEEGSTAQMAKWLKAPVLLVMDARAIARSAAALVQGYASFDPDVTVAGVICNRIGSASHLDRIQRAIAPLGIPVLGGIPRQASVEIQRRHLGLWLAQEDHLAETYIDQLADLVETHLDLDQLLDLGRQAAPVCGTPMPQTPSASPVRLGIAQDEAFCFYYAANLERLQQAGAELVYFSPLSDRLPDNLDGLYLGGGYPELHAERLANRDDLRSQLHEFAQAGRPIYAECGGLMYLSQGLITPEGRHPWAGLLPFWVQMGRRPTLGYTDVTVVATDTLFPTGSHLRGHRFHYSEQVWDTADPEAIAPTAPYQLRRWNQPPQAEGYCQGSVLASYVHLHFDSHPALAPALVQACRRGRSPSSVTI